MQRRAMILLLLVGAAGVVAGWLARGDGARDLARDEPALAADAPPPTRASPPVLGPAPSSSAAARDPEVAAALERCASVLARVEGFLANVQDPDATTSEVPREAPPRRNEEELRAMLEELVATKRPTRAHHFCWSRPQVLRAFGAPDEVETPYSGAVAWIYRPVQGEPGVKFTFLYGLVDKVAAAWPRVPIEGR